MYGITLGSEDARQARRKMRNNTTCRFNDDKGSYSVYELSSNGFSFLCPKNACPFRTEVILDRIAIVNGEGLEILAASGSIVHVTEFDSVNLRMGVHYTKKTLDRTITRKIRAPRHFPKIRLDALLIPSQNGKRNHMPGIIIDFTASTARVSFGKSPTGKIENGEEVNITISADGITLLNSQAHIMRKGDEGKEVIVRFLDQFLDIPRVESVSNALQNRSIVSSALDTFDLHDTVSDHFKALICDWRMYLARLKRALDQEESKKLYQLPSEQELFLQGIEDKVITDMMDYVLQLNAIADKLPKRESTAYKAYFRENLHPFFRASPLMASIIDKELGYSGDFETVKQFFQNPYRGNSLFGKLLNKFHCSTDTLKAHQDRIGFLYDELCSLYGKASEEFSFLALGSGPAEEVLRFVENNTFMSPVHAVLLDMDAFALADFSERLQYLPKENFMIELINTNILNLLRKKESNPVKKQHSLTYCAGLFDYFSQNTCKRLVRFMINHTKRGGTILITNVHKNNSMRHYMDYCGGWEIIHRDEEEMKALIPPEHHTETYHDRTRTNIFLKVFVS